MQIENIMDYWPMYQGVDGSPITTLTKPYSPDTDEEIVVKDASVLTEAPGLCTIYIAQGSTAAFAVVKYETVIDNVLSDLTIMFLSTANVKFPYGTFCSRKYTEYDQAAFIHNIDLLYELMKAMVEVVKPSPQIEEFKVENLPFSVPVGARFTGKQTFTHKEKYIQFFTGELSLLENNVEIMKVKPASGTTSVTFNASMVFNQPGDYTYTLQGVDFLGRTISATNTVQVLFPLYVGHLDEEIITQEGFDKLTLWDTCYDDMEVTVPSANDYIWICIAKPYSIRRVSSYGFTVPMEMPIPMLVQQDDAIIDVLCYRTTAKVLEGLNNVLDLAIDKPCATDCNCNCR